MSNDTQIVNIIRRSGPVSRSEVAKLTGLTPPTVTNITNKLLELGLIKEYMIGESSGGRRPLLLKINPEIGQIIVINIRSHKMIGHLVNAETEIQYQETSDIRGLEKEEVLEMMLDMIAKCQGKATFPVLAVGAILRGPVRSKEGISVFSPNIGWRNVPLKYIIEDKFRLPAFIENDSRALTNGEYHFGSAKDTNSMILLKVSHGIGSGIMLNGWLYRGTNNSSGEVGHTTIDVTGPECSCGNYGCLEAMASETALIGLVIKAIKEGQYSLVQDMTDGDLTKVIAQDIYAAANQGDDVSIRMLDRVARYLGIGIANLVNIFNPQLLIIAGGIAKAQKFIEQTVRQTVHDRSFESCNSILDIKFSTADTENTLKGAADIILAEITEPILLANGSNYYKAGRA